MPLGNLPVITVGLASHRLEVLPAVWEEMSHHEAIVLEEPPEKDFPDFLEGNIATADYLADKDVWFPEFSIQQLEMIKELHARGKVILQVEPYQERLIRIHESLAAGIPRAEIENRPDLREVYAAEHGTSRNLIAFYAAAHTAPFPKVVATVKEFARADAVRFRLRDTLRAAALAPLAQQFPRLYVEAGYIHLFLLKTLARLLTGKASLKLKYALASLSLAAIGRPRPMGPGDLLTLYHIFETPLSPEKENLLAARSLIHIQLLDKTEKAPGADPTPHLTDEIRAVLLSGRLSFGDCANLYPLVRKAPPEKAVGLVTNYLARK
jgi:hypothetical protein